MEDADRYDQIEALSKLKRLLDENEPDDADIRDAAIRVINRFDASLTAHKNWHPYSRRCARDRNVRKEADELGNAGVEYHREYERRLRRRIGSRTAEIRIRERPGELTIELRNDSPWRAITTTSLPLPDAKMIAARRLSNL